MSHFVNFYLMNWENNDEIAKNEEKTNLSSIIWNLYLRTKAWFRRFGIDLKPNDSNWYLWVKNDDTWSKSVVWGSNKRIEVPIDRTRVILGDCGGFWKFDIVNIKKVRDQIIWTPNYQIGPWSDDFDRQLIIWTSNYQIGPRSNNLDPKLSNWTVVWWFGPQTNNLDPKLSNRTTI